MTLRPLAATALVLLALPALRLAAPAAPRPAPALLRPASRGPLVAAGGVARCEPGPGRLVVLGPGPADRRELRHAGGPVAWRLPPGVEGDLVLGWESSTADRREGARLVLHVPATGHDLGPPGWARAPLDGPLALAPLGRPYGLPVGGHLRAQVLRRGGSAAGLVVTATAEGELAPAAVERTDPLGCAGLTLDRPGWWRLTVEAAGPPGEADLAAHLWAFAGPAPPPALEPGRVAPPPGRPGAVLGALLVCAVGVALALRRP